jgi:A/G-specific adenine glycosylase
MSRRVPLLSSAKIPALRGALLNWYDQNRRDLPWRRDPDPYRVWVSEIMLQQTRVAAVLDHYAEFMRRFPTVRSLASAREASVLTAWSGLGYYHRARRMHQAAKVIARELGGAFPQSAEAWAELPGIGRYTAAAIASIAFGEAVAVVDGNVERVLQRLLGPSGTREAVWQQAETFLARERPGDFNQAMMELGATVCTPRTPSCPECPLYPFCSLRGDETPKPQPARKTREICYALARRNNRVLLVRRALDASQMAGMWELPLLHPSPSNDTPLLRLRHSITDTDYRVAVYSVVSSSLENRAGHAQWFTCRQCLRLTLTGLARKILRRLPPESRNAAAVSNEG